MRKKLLVAGFVALTAFAGGRAMAAEPTVLYERTADSWTDADLTEWVNDNSQYVTQTIDGGLKMEGTNSAWNSTKDVAFTEFSKVTLAATLNGGSATGRGGSYDFLKLGDVEVRFDGQNKKASIVIGETETALSGYTRGGDYNITIELDQATKVVNVSVAGGATGTATGTSTITETLSNVVAGHYKAGKENYAVSEILKSIKIEEEPLAEPEPESVYDKTADSWTDADLAEWVNDNAQYVTQTIDGGLKMEGTNSAWTSTKTLPLVSNTLVTLTATLNGGAATGRANSYDFLKLGDVEVRFDGQNKKASVVIAETETALSGYTRGGDYNISIQFDQATKAVSVSVEGGATGTVTGTSAITEPLSGVSAGHYKAGKENYAVTAILKAINVEQKEQAVQIASYTINYQLDGTTVKSEEGENVVGNTVEATAPFVVEGQKYYFADGATTSLTIEAGAENVLNVAVRKAYEYNYTVKNNVNEDVKTGVCIEGESATVPYSKYILAADGKFYTKDAINQQYNYTITPDADGYVATLEYTATNKENVIFFSEGENLEGMSVATGSNANVRCSNAAGGYAEEAITVATLEPGKYIVSIGVWGNAGTPFSIKAGDAEVLAAETAGYWFETSSEEFTVEAATALTFSGAIASKPLDFIYIQKTGEYEAPAPVLNPVIELSTKPADGAVVKQISEIMLYIPMTSAMMNGETSFMFAEDPTSLITITNGTESIAVTGLEQVNMSGETLDLSVSLAQTITAAGEYTITFAEGLIIETVADADYNYLPTNNVNKELVVKVTVDPNYQYKWSFSPADGSEKNPLPTEDDEYVFIYLALPEADELSTEPFDTENAVGPWLTYNDLGLKQIKYDEMGEVISEGEWQYATVPWNSEFYGQAATRIAINKDVFKTPGTLKMRAEAGAFTVNPVYDWMTDTTVGEASPAFEYSAQFGEVKEYEYTLTPAAGDVTEEDIKSIKLEFEGAETIEFGDDFYCMFSQGWQYGIGYSEENVVIEGNTITFNLPEDFVANPGQYYLTVGEGSFLIDGINSSPAIYAPYNVLRTTPVSFLWKASPSIDVVNNGWGMDVAFYFDEIETVVPGENYSDIVVEFNEVQLPKYDYRNPDVMGYAIQPGSTDYPNVLMVSIQGGEIYDPETTGALKVTVPAGAIRVSGEANPEEFSYTWNLIKAKEYEYVITPANGATVTEISEITVEFTNAETAEVFNQYFVDFRPSDYSDYFSVESVEPVEDAEHPTFKITFNKPATAFGEYSLTIRQGAFTLDGAQESPAINATFTIDPSSGINGIYSEDGKYTVVTLSGIVVLKDAEASALEGLDKGIYIINGKKVAVK